MKDLDAGWILYTAALLPRRTQKNPKVSSKAPLDNPVSIAKMCFADLPSYADVPVPVSNLSVRNVLTLQPDFSSLRILLYAPSTAMITHTATISRHKK